MRDPYSVLGVRKSADADEIKAAWRSKAKTVHPDHNQDDPSATSRFTEVGQAYEVLKDPERRKRYDRAADMHQTIMQQREASRQAELRAAAARANAEKVMEELARANAQRAQAQAKTSNGAADETAEDMVERIFGNGSDAKPQPKAEAKPETKAETESQAQQEQAKAAAQPNAEAAADAMPKPDAGADAKTPPVLQAVELISSLVRRFRGTAPLPEKAPDLSVEATVSIEDLLKQNYVTLTLSDEREVRFPLEAGMTRGQVVRLKAQGLKIANMQRGDLLVTLRIARDTRFRVEGYDIHTSLPISLEDAVLGLDTRIETPEGPREIAVPAWSGSDQSIRMEGLGLPDDAGGRGALIIDLRVVLWEKPNEKVTDLMRHMRHGLYV